MDARQFSLLLEYLFSLTMKNVPFKKIKTFNQKENNVIVIIIEKI